MMDLTTVMPWLGAIALVLSLGNTITTFLTSGSKENAQKLDGVEQKLTSHDRRIQSVEETIKHLPDLNTVHQLELTLKDMQAEIIKITASAEQSARTSARIETYLMEKGK